MNYINQIYSGITCGRVTIFVSLQAVSESFAFSIILMQV